MEGDSNSAEERLQAALAEAKKWRAIAEVYNQDFQHFVYAASHDLQEPLRSVATYTQLLARRYTGDEEARELAAFVTSGVARMTALVQNLAVYSRIEASTSRSDVQLIAAVQAAQYKLSSLLKDTGGRVDCGAMPTVRAHEVQLAQVFEYLMHNSLLFRGAQPPVIGIFCEEGDEAYTVSVRDNGRGIEPRFHSQVLLPFKRLHGKEVPGNGLGLAICDKIVKAHGGRLWIDSDGEKGTTVRFTLPY